MLEERERLIVIMEKTSKDRQW